MSELNKDELKDKLKESLDLSFDLEQVTVSEDLILKTMEAIHNQEFKKEEQPSKERHVYATKEVYHRLPNDKKNQRRGWIHGFGNLAAACLILILASYVWKGVEQKSINQAAQEKVLDKTEFQMDFDPKKWTEGNDETVQNGITDVNPVYEGQEKAESVVEKESEIATGDPSTLKQNVEDESDSDMKSSNDISSNEFDSAPLNESVGANIDEGLEEPYNWEVDPFAPSSIEDAKDRLKSVEGNYIEESGVEDTLVVLHKTVNEKLDQDLESKDCFVIELNNMDDKEVLQSSKLEEYFALLSDQITIAPEKAVWDYKIILYLNENEAVYYKINKDAYISIDTFNLNLNTTITEHFNFNDDFEEVSKQIQEVLNNED